MLDVDKPFMKALGQRIASARKELGMNQSELAEVLGCSQPTMATYELGTRRIPVAFLPKLASLFTVTVDELLDYSSKQNTKKRGPPSKLQRQLDAIATLPRAKQKFASEMLEMFLKQHAA